MNFIHNSPRASFLAKRRGPRREATIAQGSVSALRIPLQSKIREFPHIYQERISGLGDGAMSQR